MPGIHTQKTIYDPPSPSDGKRILVMRFWPRGVKKSTLHLDRWVKELGTESSLIKKWKAGKIEWKEFAREYRKTLRENKTFLVELAEEAKKGTLSLLCSCKEEKHCHRYLLKKAIEALLNKR
ncbi:MAG: DUF488 family protein [Verrucomicrobiota bacterium]|nr:DUF488 family protein [Verrucomicrobiota bacterium]